MEIKRQIIESVTPPDNKNAWWFDSNSEVLKRCVGSSWTPVTTETEMSYLFVEPTETINTTYEEAKALYEAGDMQPGVYYRFKYYHKKSMLIEDGDDSYRSATVYHNFYINVYLDKYGDLKAKGSYVYDGTNPPEYKSFTSDYTFDIVAVDVPSYDVSEYRVFKKGVVTYTEWDYVSTLESLLHENNISYTKWDLEEGSFMIRFETPCISYYSSVGDAVVGKKTFLFNNGFYFINDEYSGDFYPGYISFKETGLLYNLDYGEYKHSYLFDGYQVNNEVFISLYGNIDNKLDNHIVVDYSEGDNSIYVDIKNCDIYICNLYNGGTIYAINTFVKMDSLDYEDVLLGDEYYGDEVALNY